MLIVSISFKGGNVYDFDGPRTVQGFKDFVANPEPPKPEEVEIEYVDETGAEPIVLDASKLKSEL